MIIAHKKKSDENLWAEGLEAWNTLGRDPDLVKEINRYMRDVLKLGYSISLQEIALLNRDGNIIKNQKKNSNSEAFKVDRIKLYNEENDILFGISQMLVLVSPKLFLF